MRLIKIIPTSFILVLLINTITLGELKAQKTIKDNTIMSAKVALTMKANKISNLAKFDGLLIRDELVTKLFGSEYADSWAYVIDTNGKYLNDYIALYSIDTTGEDNSLIEKIISAAHCKTDYSPSTISSNACFNGYILAKKTSYTTTAAMTEEFEVVVVTDIVIYLVAKGKENLELKKSITGKLQCIGTSSKLGYSATYYDINGNVIYNTSVLNIADHMSPEDCKRKADEWKDNVKAVGTMHSAAVGATVLLLIGGAAASAGIATAGAGFTALALAGAAGTSAGSIALCAWTIAATELSDYIYKSCMTDVKLEDLKPSSEDIITWKPVSAMEVGLSASGCPFGTSIAVVQTCWSCDKYEYVENEEGVTTLIITARTCCETEVQCIQ